MLKDAIEAPRLLIVSRDSAFLRPLWSMAESNGWLLEIAADPWEAIDKTQSGVTLDLLLLDSPQGSADSLHSLRWLRRLRPALPIILIGHSDDNGMRQESLRMGARDCIVRPIDNSHLEAMILRNIAMASEFAETDIDSDDVEPVSNETFFIGVSPIMRKLRAQAALLAEASVPALILGEDGSGKETTARLIHSLSIRSGFEFAKVNCAALPGELLERELFGCAGKGTAASSRPAPGKLELCAKGTIFLDEITEMPPGLQANLLEVIENKRFIRPGTTEFIDADVRVLAASSINIERAVAEHRICEDLYNRLADYTIHVPSLRNRKEELSFLSRHFMHRLAKHYGLPPRDFSPGILEAWQAYSWPGNLRELERSVKRYLMVGDEELSFSPSASDSDGDLREIAPSRFYNLTQIDPPSAHSHAGVSGSKSLRSLVQSVKAEAERNAIAMALEKTGWNRKAAARLLKVSYRTVLYKIEQYRMTASNSSVFERANGARTEENGSRGGARAKTPGREMSLPRAVNGGR